MDMTGEYRIPAPRERVWQALNDPDVLKASIPGCQSLERTAEDEFAAKVVAKVGPVKATFNGQVKLQNINAPESYTISGEGKGGAAGFAKGGADVHLREDGAETVLTYTAKADVGGKLAQLGSRLIQGTAKKMADEFFDNFRKQLTAPEPAAAAPPPPVEVPAAPPAAAPSGAEVTEPTPVGAPTAPPAVDRPRPDVGAPPVTGAPSTSPTVERPRPEVSAPPAVEAPRSEPARPAEPMSDTFAGLAQNRFVWAAAAIVVIMLIIMMFR